MASFIIFFLFTFAWGQVDSELPVDQEPVNQAEQAPPVEPEPLVEMSKIQTFLRPFVYDRDKFRDPFEAQGAGTPLKVGQVYGPFLEIQTYNLNSFKLNGLMWKTKNPVAIFQAPNGNEYRLRIKDYIGENFGYIASIREKEVVVIQTIEEGNRRYSTAKVVFLESSTQQRREQ